MSPGRSKPPAATACTAPANSSLQPYSPSSPLPLFPQEQTADGYETRTYEAAVWAYVTIEKAKSVQEGYMEGEWVL